MACAEGVQDNPPPGGFNAGGSTSSGGKSGATSGSAGRGGGPVEIAGGSTSGGSTSGGSTTGGSATGGASAGASSGGNGGSGTAGSPAGGAPAGGASAGGAPAGGAPAGGAPAGGAPAGGAPAGGAGGGTAATGFYVQYQNAKTTSSSAYIGCLLRGINNGTATVAVNQFKMRYYFTDEVMKTASITIGYSKIAMPGNQAGLMVTNTITTMPTPKPTADKYIEFSFSSSDHPMLASQEVLEFTFQLQGPAPSSDLYTQNNDYSWDASGTLENWDHVVLLQGGSVIWGTPP